MTRKGRLLEVLVKQLQEFLGPEELEIRSPELFYHNGEQIGEIDVTIRGRIGATTVFLGLECRDRPKDGPQGIPWLEQIFGKKQLFKVDKMVAVSSTGYTSEAIAAAEQFGIDLLVVENTDSINFSEWFDMIGFSWQQEYYEISETIEIETEPKTKKGIVPLKRGTPFLQLQGANRLLSLDEFIKPDLDDLFMQLPSIENGIVHAEAEIRGAGLLSAIVGGEQIKITRLVIPVKMSREVVRVSLLLNLCRNISQNEVLALTGIGTVETSKGKLKVMAITKRTADNSSMRDFQVSFLTEDNKPYNFPEGTVIRLYGVPDKTE